jgi:hypothetical protein
MVLHNEAGPTPDRDGACRAADRASPAPATLDTRTQKKPWHDKRLNKLGWLRTAGAGGAAAALEEQLAAAQAARIGAEAALAQGLAAAEEEAQVRTGTSNRLRRLQDGRRLVEAARMR